MPLTNVVGSHSAASGSDAASYSALVLSLQSGDPEGLQELHNLMHHSARAYFGRKVGYGEADDLFAEAFLAVVGGIQRGGLRQPACLMGFVRTVLRRQVAAYVRTAVRNRSSHGDLPRHLYGERFDIEDDLIRRETAELLASTLRDLSLRDREVLSRFYLKNETKEQICAEMSLTETQFRLVKSRAKARLKERLQRRTARQNVASS